MVTLSLILDGLGAHTSVRFLLVPYVNANDKMEPVGGGCVRYVSTCIGCESISLCMPRVSFGFFSLAQ